MSSPSWDDDTPDHPMMSTPFLTGPNLPPEWAVNSPKVSRRAPRAGGRTAIRFGLWLKTQREAFGKRNSYEEIERQLRETGGHFVTSSTLQRYETKGRVPDVLTILALAQLYGFDFSRATLMLTRELTEGSTTIVRDKKDSLRVESPPPPSEGADDGNEIAALRTEIQQLRHEIATNAGLLNGISDRLTALGKSETAPARVPQSGTNKSKRR